MNAYHVVLLNLLVELLLSNITIFDEEMEVINNIDNFNFDIPFIGGGNISKGIISLEVPYVNKIVALNQTDLEVLKESLISLKTK